MKLFKYFLIFTVLFTSCKSTKTVTDKGSTKNLLAKKITKNHISSQFNRNTLDAKLKVKYEGPKQKVDFSVRMKIKKDEVIWMKGSKFITVFKAKITPDKVSFYSPYKKNYIEGNFNTLKEILGFEVNFHQLQNLLLGQTLYDLDKEKHTVSTVNDTYIVTPKKQPDLFDIIYKINNTHFKLNEQNLTNTVKQQHLDITYPSYKETDNTLFPEAINIKASQKTKESNINISVRSLIFDEEISIPYQIPQGYKEIKL